MCRKLSYLVSFVFVLSLTLTGPANGKLVGWWKLDETSGTIAYDSSDNGDDGTLNGSLQWQPAGGMLGGALKFDGSASYVLIPYSNSLNLINQGDFTLAMWFRQDVVSGIANLVQQTDRNGTGRTLLLADASNGIRAYLGGVTTLSGVIEQAGIWYHVAMVVTEEGATDTVQFYINGQPSGTPGQVGSESCQGDYLIGTSKTLDGRWLTGLVDDVRFYNHALSETEVLAAMKGAGASYPFAHSPSPADGTLYPDTWVNLSWSSGDFAVSHDVYLGDNLDDVNNATHESELFRGNQTSTTFMAGFPGYAYPDGLVPGTTYYWRIDEVNDAEPNSPWKGPIWSFSIPPNTAYNPSPADGAEFVGPDVTLTWTPGFGAKLHHVYLGTNRADVEAGTPDTDKGPAGVASFTPKLESEKVYYWRIDEFDGIGTYKGDIWAFTTPGAAGAPQPANGAADVQMTAKLTWTPATTATSHQIYFGTDKDAVTNATTASPEYKGNKPIGSESYDPGQLAWHTTYYWRVDAVYSTGTVKGLVWKFTTADFLLIDDFESYNDIDPPDPNSNRIFEAWIDGFGTTNNGALVGNDLPPYTEQTIVHGGTQSMPYSYDNNLKTSEATKTLVYPRDWTQDGVGELSLWFRGDPANAAERMYVALNGSAVVYNDTPNASQKVAWTQWVIDLQAFADQGVNLTNVNTITIGFGTKNSPAAGGSGKMYFDDIRLYRSPTAP
jgi:Concanavalin A-like lectin/glucanases superfamily